jgi:hypothetical protein
MCCCFAALLLCEHNKRLSDCLMIVVIQMVGFERVFLEAALAAERFCCCCCLHAQ